MSEPATSGIPTEIELPAATFSAVPYGDHERNVMEVWLPSAAKGPCPAVMYVHGGAWVNGDRFRVNLPGGVQPLLDAGIAVISIQYRYVPQLFVGRDALPEPIACSGRVAREEPPVSVPLFDAARALQTIRHRAAEWNIDPARIGVSGSSAGACTALWLALSPDRADPQSADPVARESSTPRLAAVMNAQTTLDPVQLREWNPHCTYGGQAFGMPWNPEDESAEFRLFCEHRDTLLPWIERYSPYALVHRGAPPICLFYKSRMAPGEKPGDPVHCSLYAPPFQARLRELGVPCEVIYPDAGCRFGNVTEFLLSELPKTR